MRNATASDAYTGSAHTGTHTNNDRTQSRNMPARSRLQTKDTYDARTDTRNARIDTRTDTRTYARTDARADSARNNGPHASNPGSGSRRRAAEARPPTPSDIEGEQEAAAAEKHSDDQSDADRAHTDPRLVIVSWICSLALGFLMWTERTAAVTQRQDHHQVVRTSNPQHGQAHAATCYGQIHGRWPVPMVSRRPRRGGPAR